MTARTVARRPDVKKFDVDINNKEQMGRMFDIVEVYMEFKGYSTNRLELGKQWMISNVYREDLDEIIKIMERGNNSKVERHNDSK